MKWQNHVVVSAALAAAVNPVLIPVAILGATAPDWLEWLIVPFFRVRHRTVTHYVIVWILAIAFFAVVWDYRHFGLAFSLGGFGHVLADAFTVSGVPFGWWSTNRFYLFGGRLRTGHPGEYFAALAIALICGYIATHTEPMDLGNGNTDKPITKQFFPFFYDHHDNYKKGLLDGKEWKDNRLKFF